MVTVLLWMVVLAESHDDLVSMDRAESLFGKEIVRQFLRRFPEIPVHEGYIGHGDRHASMRKRSVSRRKLDRARRFMRKLSFVCWIRFAGVTGSVGFGNAERADDIDLFLIVQDRRVWLTRLVTEIVLRVAGVRRPYGKEKKGDVFCVNYYVSEHALDVRHEGTNDFLAALELVSMRPVLHEEFMTTVMAHNRWIEQYFPPAAARFMSSEQNTVDTVRSAAGMHGGRMPILSTVLDGADLAARFLQIAYMRMLRHPTDTVLLEPNRIQFFDRTVWEKREQELRRRLHQYHVRFPENVSGN